MLPLSDIVPVSNRENPSSPTSSGPLPPPEPPGPPPTPTPSSPEWTLEQTAELMESILSTTTKVNGRIFQVNRKSPFAPLKVFACYLNFCQRAFNGRPPEWCTVAEYERKMLEVLPPTMCLQDDGTRALF